MLMGAVRSRGARTSTPGATASPARANSSTSGGYSPEVAFMASAWRSSTTFTTKSPVCSRLRTVSFRPFTRRPEEKAMVGGSLHAHEEAEGRQVGHAVGRHCGDPGDGARHDAANEELVRGGDADDVGIQLHGGLRSSRGRLPGE